LQSATHDPNTLFRRLIAQNASPLGCPEEVLDDTLRELRDEGVVQGTTPVSGTSTRFVRGFTIYHRWAGRVAIASIITRRGCSSVEPSSCNVFFANRFSYQAARASCATATGENAPT
jgi:hypothetical protein